MTDKMFNYHIYVTFKSGDSRSASFDGILRCEEITADNYGGLKDSIRQKIKNAGHTLNIFNDSMVIKSLNKL